MGKAVERIFLPAMKMTIPELVDVHLPVEAVFHNLMIVSIRKSYPGQARKVMNAIWSLGQAMFTKCIIVVDEDCDVQDIPEVVLRVANNIDPERDIQFTLGPVDSLDHASAPAQLRIEDGDRRHAQMEGGRLRPPLAGDDRDGRRHQSEDRRDLGEAGSLIGSRQAGLQRLTFLLRSGIPESMVGVFRGILLGLAAVNAPLRPTADRPAISRQLPLGRLPRATGSGRRHLGHALA